MILKDSKFNPKITGALFGAMVGLPLFLGAGAFYFYSPNRIISKTAQFSNTPINDSSPLLSIYGNKKSKVYHLPNCPNYDDISEKNKVIIKTMLEAEERGFRISGNCPPNAINKRKKQENAPNDVGIKGRRKRR